MINYINIYIPFMIVCSLLLAGPQPILNSFFDLTTGTPTGGIFSQTPTGTSSTPSQTYTPTITPSTTPTTTLMPLPAITLIFPAPTIYSTPTKTPIPALGTHTPNYSEVSKSESVPPRTKVLSIIIVIIWLFLACFSVIYIRQFR